MHDAKSYSLTCISLSSEEIPIFFPLFFLKKYIYYFLLVFQNKTKTLFFVLPKHNLHFLTCSLIPPLVLLFLSGLQMSKQHSLSASTGDVSFWFQSGHLYAEPLVESFSFRAQETVSIESEANLDSNHLLFPWCLFEQDIGLEDTMKGFWNALSDVLRDRWLSTGIYDVETKTAKVTDRQKSYFRLMCENGVCVSSVASYALLLRAAAEIFKT